MAEPAAGPAAQVLLDEASALVAAASRLDADAFRAAVELVLGCRGKVVTTGAGTSGVVARKVAATLTSTGTPAVFVPPTDAVHGQLGLITSDDVVVAVSNGGETAEVLALLPYLRSRATPVISFVGNPRSSLAQSSAVALDAGVAREACPLDITPTSSTTVAIALGDALALALRGERGLTQEDFARNHPSGRLGRRLTLRVEDLLAVAAAEATVAAGDGILDVIGRISSGGAGAVVVVEEGVLVGIVTDGDVRRAVQRAAGDLLALTASEVMTRRPVVIAPRAHAFEALERMETARSPISVLPVVDDDGRCLGIVRLHDLVRAGL